MGYEEIDPRYFLFLFIKECGILIMSMGNEEYLIYIYLKYIFIIKNLFFIFLIFFFYFIKFFIK